MGIEIARFLQRTYAYRKHEKNQGIFVVKCFLSAGSHHFEMPDKYNQTSTELETPRMLMKEDTIYPLKNRMERLRREECYDKGQEIA